MIINRINYIHHNPVKRGYVDEVVNNLKGRSSRLRRDIPNIKERYCGKEGLWHRSYFAGSVGGGSLEIVEQYIEQQKTPN